jgi:uncharacterized membrane protein HdeD (DUF308 family)
VDVQQKHPQLPRFVGAALFSATSAISEALKIIAGFDQRPDGSQWWSFAGVLLTAATLGWMTAPAMELVGSGILKKINVSAPSVTLC